MRISLSIVLKKYFKFERPSFFSKWQQSQGSVDEKFPYLYLNCIQAMPEREIILLIDGNGYKPGALAWLKQAVASQDAKLIHVFNLVEFLVWANRRLRQK